MKKLVILLSMIFFVLTLVACSQNEATTKQEDNEEPKTKEVTEAVEPIVISGVLGDVELSEPAKNVVALEWTYAENLLALDVQPAGVTDIENYHNWVKIEKEFDETVVDVGTRQEPSLEAIAQLNPDLIIAIKFRHEAIRDQLESIAPTVFFDPYPSDENFSQYAEMEATFIEIAKAVGKEEKAVEVLDDLNNKYEEAKTVIENADLATKDVLLTQAWSADQVPTIRVFTTNSLASVILEKLGLNNPFVSEQFEVYGFSTVGVEALTNYESANFLYVVQDDDNIYENQLKDNNVWKGLNFVEENRTYPLGGDAWLFGGPLSAKVVIDRIVDTLVNN
ncbi:ferrichrome ABC transporter substrate-binding protein [Anaerobacillus alkalidiazotrophicus]|uniref:Ferrichrome ABC transporter substrate-binding protein n=1 Tax=Anaerobacillus alkalidiazotrophicus TaxID=472963 RepID=A0A1S2M341_9BACI|nr:iron-siderophore ABC transporter substrate-binding protein [Anaerobacillus alkalidiazotrophicus]OIJ19054.1 ferrichrome ABC transporter substrate-binding protein [Anaerobacillus alkalidiazotrophicus]